LHVVDSHTSGRNYFCLITKFGKKIENISKLKLHVLLQAEDFQYGGFDLEV